MLGSTIRNVVTTAPWHPRFVCLYINDDAYLFVPGLKYMYRPQCGSRLERFRLLSHIIRGKM